MIPFPFNENRFSFFVADHVLVGQWCTNSESDRSLLSCLKVTQCSTSEIGDAPLFNSYSLLIHVMTIASTLKMQIRIVQRLKAQLNASDDPSDGYGYGFGLVSSEGHIMPPHIFEVGLKVNTKVYLVILKSMVIPWCNQGAGGRPLVWQQDSAQAHNSKETQARRRKECYDFVPFSHWPPPPPTWTRWSTSFGHSSKNITNVTSYNTKASMIAAIHRVFAELPPALVEKACSQFWNPYWKKRKPVFIKRKWNHVFSRTTILTCIYILKWTSRHKECFVKFKKGLWEQD